jgi:hypothetical protein
MSGFVIVYEKEFAHGQLFREKIKEIKDMKSELFDAQTVRTEIFECDKTKTVFDIRRTKNERYFCEFEATNNGKQSLKQTMQCGGADAALEQGIRLFRNSISNENVRRSFSLWIKQFDTMLPENEPPAVIENLPALPSDEALERERALAHIEGKFPYHRERYLAEIEICLKRAEMSYIEAGKMFLVMREREQGEFLHIIQDRFPQYSQSIIYGMMRAALVFEEHPKIAQKIIDLPKTSVIEICRLPAEDLTELEEKGVLAGKDLDDISRMPVRELRDFARKHKDEKEKLVREAVKEKTSELSAEIEYLKNENRALTRRLPENFETSLYLEEIADLKRLNEEFLKKSLKIKFNDELLEDVVTCGKIVVENRAMENNVRMFTERFEQFLDRSPYADED